MPIQICSSKATRSSTTLPSTTTSSTAPPQTPPFKTTNNPIEGFPQHIKKQLLVDIKEGGGIYCTKFKHLCNHNPQLYGQPASLRCRQAQNKHQKWKSLDLAGYFQLLHKFGVVPNRIE
jgi:hypothetical protein